MGQDEAEGEEEKWVDEKAQAKSEQKRKEMVRAGDVDVARSWNWNSKQGQLTSEIQQQKHNRKQSK